MSKIALAFPGIGVELSGRERVFFDEHRSKVEPFFSEASEIAGVNLTNYLVEQKSEPADSDCLPRHLFALAFGAGFAKVLEEANVRGDYAAGFSFGIYAVLFASKAVCFSDCARIVVRAHELSSEACREKNVAMAAVVGLTIPEVQEILASVGGDVQIVNVITETCAIIAGNSEAVDACIRDAEDRDSLRAGRLSVRAAYHHPAYLGDASREFAEFLKSVPFSSPVFPVVSSVDFSLITTGTRLRNFTAENLGLPIHWLNVVRTLSARGVTGIIEAGAGISLTRNGSFMPFDIFYANVKNYRRKLGL